MQKILDNSAPVTLPVTHGTFTVIAKNGEEIVLDKINESLVSKYKWNVQYAKSGKMYARTSVWMKDEKRYQQIYMHRLLLGLVAGDSSFVDHINNNGLDNRMENIRVATCSQNTANTKVRCSSGFKGVTRHKNRWQASITVNGKSIYLGRFINIKDASMAYKLAAKSHFGEFANFSGETV